MKTQNYHLATKAYQKEDSPLWPVFLIALIVIMSMARYNITVSFDKANLETLPAVASK